MPGQFGPLGVVAVAVTLAAIVLSLGPAVGGADAARPCRPISLLGETLVRVAGSQVSCAEARRVAKEYFERVLAGDEPDGRTRDGAIYFSVEGFAA